MTAPLTLSLDAMGGDNAPAIVVHGVRLARKRFPDVRFRLYGDAPQIEAVMRKAKGVPEVATVHHCDLAVTNDMKPSQVLRTHRASSMGLAIQAVVNGEADGVVSAGNTGALMAMSKLMLRTLPGISRPAIAALCPTMQGECVVLDLGANASCNAAHLVEFAVMGEVFARAVLGLERPSVGLLNIGSEDQKGREEIREAAQLLRESDLPIRFEGFVEGDGVVAGAADVVVTDGFTGNVALKTMEGTAKLYTHYLKEAFRSSLLAKLGYKLAARAMTKVRLRTDPRRHNGAMFLGLSGIAVKSHGGTDALGFANAIGVAIDLIRQGFNERIKAELQAHAPTPPPSAAPEAAAV